MLKADLHVHTADDPVDRISYSTFDVIDRAAELGYGAIAVTLHDRQLDPAPYAAYAAARGLVLIPGIERTIRGRHVLLLNFSCATEAVQTFDDLAALKRAEPGGLVIAPHPFFPSSTALLTDLDRHADLFDAVEYNAMFTRVLNFNLFAERWARTHDKPMVGNGDVHRLRQLGTTYTLVDAEPNVNSICAAIARGRIRVVAEPLPAFTVVTVLADLFSDGFMNRFRYARRGAPDARAATNFDGHLRTTI
jgi:predicted metal-dependent phosphoesterase TrpH